MAWVGGTKYNKHIEATKKAGKTIREQVMLISDDMDDVRLANQDNPEVLNFLLTQASRLVIISAQIDRINSEQDGLRDIGAEARLDRTKADDDEE